MRRAETLTAAAAWAFIALRDHARRTRDGAPLMAGYGERIPSAGRPIDPTQVVRSIRWIGDLAAIEIVEAIHAVADHPDVAVWWPELTAAEIAELRDQARAMTKSRLRAWDARGERQPTWLEVRALISGLRLTLT